MAFRSETEQLREQLRREQEIIARLIEEKADLERQITLKKRAWPLALIAIAVTVSVAVFAFSLASYDGNARVNVAEHRHRLEVEKLLKEQAESVKREDEANKAVATCRRDVASLVARECSPCRKTPCNCQVGDPLCSCL